MKKKSAFSRYAPFIQEYIYKKGWRDLYSIQNQACDAILDTDKDIILASGTATGKTEAVLFPILTELIRNPSESISILYIGPLKALINDQFKRLEELLEDSEFPVFPWHGDVSQSVKDKAKKVKRGIIQITPESLEALLMNHPELIESLFSDLRYIIIDEIHALMGTDRGLQVISQINRIERISHRRPRRIGLSATLGNFSQVVDFISTGEPERVIALGTNAAPQQVGIRVESFLSPQNGENPRPNEALNYIYDRTRLSKSIIFTNSRSEAEQIIALLRKIAIVNHDRDIYRIHHGSLSASLRHQTESELRDSSNPIVVAATLTLELGIDIGSLDQIIQIGAPFTCSNFIQRLGRSGRLTGKSLMRFITFFQTSDFNSPLDIPWDLLRSIAIIELYRTEHWIEPFEQKEKPYSLLVHQTLSILASYKELMPADLARHVLTLYPFKDRISQEEYQYILRSLLADEYIEQLENGTLIIGLEGEKLINNYRFFSVFNEREEFKVIYNGREIGSLSNSPEVGQIFTLGGKSWQVVDINSRTKTVQVESHSHFRAPSWSSGEIEINSRIYEKIKDILTDDTIYPYLSIKAQEILQKVREYARSSGMLSGIVLDPQENGIYLFPWSGTKESRTLVHLFRTVLNSVLKIKRATPYEGLIYLQTNLPIGLFIGILQELDFEKLLESDLFDTFYAKNMDKFDYLLPDELKKVATIKNYFDLESAKKVLKDLTENLNYSESNFFNAGVIH